MIDYLKACGLNEEYEKYRSVVKDRWDRHDRLSRKEIRDMQEEVLSLLFVQEYILNKGVF